MMAQLIPMTDERLLAAAPSIFALSPRQDVSDRYTQVRTIDVVNTMRGQGWEPVRARQMHVRREQRIGFCKHEIRFQRQGDSTLSQVGDETLQAIMTNSHDRSSSFHFQLGVFRLACLNGLCVATGMFNEIRVRHVGFDPGQIQDATEQIAAGGARVAEHIRAMKDTMLSEGERLALATAATKLLMDPERVNDGEVRIEPGQLLAPRRYADQGDDLWKTFNRVQENALKGGLRYYRRQRDGNMHRAKTMAVKSIDKDLRLNQALWALAEEMLKLKGVTVAA